MQLRFKFATMLVLAAALVGSVTPPEASAGPSTQPTIQFQLQGNFNGATGGGGSSANAVLSGTTDPGLTNLSRLSGNLNLGGVRDYNFQVNPTGLVTPTNSTQPLFPWCDVFDPNTGQCVGQPHFCVQLFQGRSVPVDLHFGGSHGNGTLNWGTSSFSDCPLGFPPSQSFVNLFGGVNGAQTAGQLNFFGGQVTIQQG